jgi:hypothetical protein
MAVVPIVNSLYLLILWLTPLMQKSRDTGLRLFILSAKLGFSGIIFYGFLSIVMGVEDVLQVDDNPSHSLVLKVSVVSTVGMVLGIGAILLSAIMNIAFYLTSRQNAIDNSLALSFQSSSSSTAAFPVGRGGQFGLYYDLGVKPQSRRWRLNRLSAALFVFTLATYIAVLTLNYVQIRVGGAIGLAKGDKASRNVHLVTFIFEVLNSSSSWTRYVIAGVFGLTSFLAPGVGLLCWLYVLVAPQHREVVNQIQLVSLGFNALPEMLCMSAIVALEVDQIAKWVLNNQFSDACKALVDAVHMGCISVDIQFLEGFWSLIACSLGFIALTFMSFKDLKVDRPEGQALDADQKALLSSHY